jgi:hypothetical protein
MNLIISLFCKSAITALLFSGNPVGNNPVGSNPIGDAIGGSAIGGSAIDGSATGGKAKGSASTAEVKYVDNKEGAYVFNVIYDNAAGSRFSLRVLDEQGNQLYQSFFSDKKFDKKFMITETEGQFTFIIRNYQDNSIQRFEVNSNTHLVEDFEVKELK